MDRPVVHCVVGKVLADGACHVVKHAVTLAEAEDFAAFGFTVIVDPFDMEALTRFLQIEDSMNRKPRWHRW